MERIVLARILGLVFFFSLAFAGSALELEVFARTNQMRLEQGLQAVEWDSLAYNAARGHAVDMLERNFFAHDTPEGITPGMRMEKAGVLEYETGENLALYENYTDEKIPSLAVEGWMKSPGHRANLLKPSFTHLGVAVVRKGSRVVVVQNFLARPFEIGQPSLEPTVASRVQLLLSGTAPGTLGIFINRNLFTKINPPFNAAFELPPDPRPDLSFGLWDGQSWFKVEPGKYGLNIAYRLEVFPAPGQRVRFSLPPGTYLIALGKNPKPWRSLTGGAGFQFDIPGTYQYLWLGKVDGSKVRYTHRIPLKP
ncbi:MAG: CAP domain-containing protein [Deinococcus sp.]|nr:CAP domain-containing protein [Deinococcus sp.]